MTAVATAIQTIDWALVGSGPPPRGDWREAEQLADPPAEAREALRRLVGLTAARLHWMIAARDDRHCVGVGTLVMAAAIGGAHQGKIARMMLGHVPETGQPADWIAQHGLVRAALPYLTQELAVDCRSRSPLTEILDVPAADGEGRAFDALRQLLPQRAARSSLILHLAQVTDSRSVRAWRTSLLDRLRPGTAPERSFVLDVYEAQMIHQQREAIDQVRQAHQQIVRGLATGNAAVLDDAVSVARWWGPLWHLARSDNEAMRARPYLGYAYHEGLALYGLSRKLTGVTT